MKTNILTRKFFLFFNLFFISNIIAAELDNNENDDEIAQLTYESPLYKETLKKISEATPRPRSTFDESPFVDLQAYKGDNTAFTLITNNNNYTKMIKRLLAQKEKLALNDEKIPQIDFLIGKAYFKLNNYYKAWNYFNLAYHQNTNQSIKDKTHEFMKQVDEICKEQIDSLENLKTKYSKTDTDLPRVNLELATIYYLAGGYTEAKEYAYAAINQDEDIDIKKKAIILFQKIPSLPSPTEQFTDNSPSLTESPNSHSPENVQESKVDDINPFYIADYVPYYVL